METIFQVWCLGTVAYILATRPLKSSGSESQQPSNSLAQQQKEYADENSSGVIKMNRNSSGVETNGELRILLVVTVVIGLLLMLSLLMCYACVLKRLCCGTARERAKNKAYGRRSESYPMGDVTLISQPTESERV